MRALAKEYEAKYADEEEHTEKGEDEVADKNKAVLKETERKDTKTAGKKRKSEDKAHDIQKKAGCANLGSGCMCMEQVCTGVCRWGF